MAEDHAAAPAAPANPKDSFKQSVSSAVSWSFAGQVIAQTLQTAISVVLARVLSPREFGLVGMVTVFTGFSVMVASMGFGAALIQIPKLEDRHLNTIFWINLIAGTALSALLLVAAPFIADFYRQPQLANVCRACAPAVFFQLTTAVPIAMRNRSLGFKGLVITESIAGVVAGGVAIVLALKHFGPYALVAQTFAMAATNSALLWKRCPFRPSFKMDRGALRELFGFSSQLFGFQFVNYWMRNADNLLVGKFVGVEALGAYSRAYMWMLIPMAQVSQVVSRVMFPALSRVQHDIPRVKRLYLRTASAIALVTFPLMLGMMVVCELFVLTLLGERWRSVVPLLEILAVVGLMQSIGTTTGLIYQSLGRTDLQLYWGIGAGVVTFAAFVIGLPWGVLGVTVAYALRSVLLAYWNYLIPGRLIGMKPQEVFAATRGALGCAILMCGPVFVLRSALPSDWPRWLRLMLCVALGGVSYAALLWLVKPRGFNDVHELVLNRLGALRRAGGRPTGRSVAP
jgi:O-antigen/teichoic acid export membrane protein